MKPHGRMARVNRLIQTTLGEMIPGAVRDGRIHQGQMISVVEVRTTPDLQHAKVFLSIVAAEGEREAALEGIQHAGGYLRGVLGRRLKLRRVPELHFTLDETDREAGRIEAILRDIAAEQAQGAGADDQDPGARGEGEGGDE